MTQEEFNQHLLTLENNEMDYLSQKLKVSAEFFQRTVERGHDISLAIPKLIQAFNECNQVPTMEPLARAVTCYYLNKADSASLRQIANSARFGRYYIAAILYYAKKKKDVFLLKDVLLDFFPKEEYLVIEILGFCLKKDSDNRFEILLEAIYKHPQTKKKLSKFLEKAKEFPVDLTKALPFLLSLLKTKLYESDASSCLRWVTEFGVDISSIRLELIDILDSKKNKDVRYKSLSAKDITGSWSLSFYNRKASSQTRSKLCYSLSYFALRKKDWDFIDERLSINDIELRRACLISISNFLISKNPVDTFSFLDRLLLSLVYVDTNTGNLILSSIRTGIDTRKNFLPSEKILINLIRKLILPEYPTQITEALYLLAKYSKENANQIIRLLKSEKVNKTLTGFILKLLNGKSECKTCSKIPLSENYSHEFLIPGEVFSLEILEDSSLRKCPECNNHYQYSYDEEWEDMAYRQTWLITRLSPDETLDSLNGEKKEKYKGIFPKLIRKLKDNIFHPEKKIREEASRFYAKHLLKIGDWLNLEKLLYLPDEDVILSVLKILDDYSIAKLVKPLETNLKKLMMNEKTTYYATKVLANYFISLKDVASIENLLHSPEENIILATLHCLWLAKNFEPYNMNPHFTSLRNLIRHKNEEIRRYSHYVLEQVTGLDDNASMEDIIFIIQRTKGDGAEEALTALQKHARLKKDVSRAIPYIGKLIHREKTSWKAAQTLKTFAQEKIDISPVYADIEKKLKNKRFSEKNDLIWILELAFSYGQKTEATINCLAPLLNQEEYRSSAIPFLEKCFFYGMDISSVVKHLRKAIHYKGEDSYRETAIKILVQYYAQKENWEEIRDLLANKDKHIVGAASIALHEMLEKQQDISTVIDLVELNLNHPYWFVKEESKLILEKWKG